MTATPAHQLETGSPEWHARRATGIGGSDFGGDPNTDERDRRVEVVVSSTRLTSGSIWCLLERLHS
ncbi:MAG: hypothetical protein GY906_11505 [bacterium]|nr:hypothetical protein [bacterium]